LECNFETKLADYNAVKQGPGFDMVAEIFESQRNVQLSFPPDPI
jgi:hypothetical protein